MRDGIHIRTAYDYIEPSPYVDDCGEVLVKTSMADSLDINNIVERYHQTGLLPVIGRGEFADVSEMGDYRTALHALDEAETAFMKLPAKVREKFDNDPAAFLDFVTNDENYEEMQELGIVEKKAPEASSSTASGEGASGDAEGGDE